MAHVPYSARSEWADLSPVPQDDGPNPLVPIAYTNEYVDVMDYFRAVLLANEMSERAFALTQDVIRLSPGNYTAWGFRRKLLKALNKDLYEELQYTEDVGLENPKNYQVWHHRQVVVAMLDDGSLELAFCNTMLEDDAKNYHSWMHRQWAVKTFGLWENELDFVDILLQKDVRNNSAWNYRHFLITSTTGFTNEVVERELNYVFDWIAVAPHNESPWNYLKGALMAGRKYADYPQVNQTCVQLLESGCRAAPLLCVLIEIGMEEARPGDVEAKERICGWLDVLETEVDVIRAKYWAMRRANVERALAAV